jgi:hypothetical protein
LLKSFAYSQMVSEGKVWTYIEVKFVIHARHTPNGSTIGQSKSAMQQTPRDAPRLGLVPHLTTTKIIRQNESPLQQCHNATVRRLPPDDLHFCLVTSRKRKG